MTKKKVILITDGDVYANKAIQVVSEELGGTLVSQMHLDETNVTANALLSLIFEAKEEPIYVTFDDCGVVGSGRGEHLMLAVAKHPNIQVLGILAVASNTHQAEWAKIDVSINRFGEIVANGVDKAGIEEMELKRINGDTIYIIDEIDAPIKVGIGDIGKMSKIDSFENGSPITKQAIELILERSDSSGR